MSFNHKRATIGILLAAIGVFFLLNNLGYRFYLPYQLMSWPAILILLGIINGVSGNRRPAFILLGLGVFFYMDQFGIIEVHTFWPVILIVIGLSFLFKPKMQPMSHPKNSEDVIDDLALFGGNKKKFVSENFRGGKITCLFGGSEIDLRECKAQNGVAIEIFCMFGGVELILPSNWKVNMDATAIFGGFNDARKSKDSEATVTLHIKGFTMFGGGEIKN